MTSYSVMFSFFMHDYYKKRGSYKRYGRRVHLLAFSLFLSFGLGLGREYLLCSVLSVRRGYSLIVILSYFSLFSNTSDMFLFLGFHYNIQCSMHNSKEEIYNHQVSGFG